MFADVSLEAVLIFIRAVFLIGACSVMALAFVRWRRDANLQAQRLFEQLDLALVEMRAMQEVITRIESRVDALSGQVEAGSRQPPVQAGTAARGYDLAVRLAKRGAPIEELVASCGITRHEAELLVRLHTSRTPAPHAPSNSRETSRSPAPESKAQVTWPLPSQPAASEPPRNAVRKRGSLLSVVG